MVDGQISYKMLSCIGNCMSSKLGNWRIYKIRQSLVMPVTMKNLRTEGEIC